MNQPSIEYFAGLFDGEGCISLFKAKPQWVSSHSLSPRYNIRLGLRMTDPRPVIAFQKFFGGYIHFQEKRQPQHKPTHCVTCFGKKADEIIKKLLPYLITKKEEVKLAIEFWQYMQESNCSHKVGFARKKVPDYILEKRHQYYLKMKELKHQIVPLPE